VRAGIVNPSSLGPNIKKRKKLEKEKKVEDSRQIEEIRMLDDIPNNPLASFKNVLLMKFSLFCKMMLVIPLLILTKQVLTLILQIML
jgi:hypothetical protein